MDFERNFTEVIGVRNSATWRLLAADKGDCVIALLKTVLFDDMRFHVLEGSVLASRVSDGLEALRAKGKDFPRTALEYLNAWVGEGYLIRRFPPGAMEEEFELSGASIDAIRFVSNLARPLPTMTESRLAMVIQAVSKLSDDTDPDVGRRLQRLREDLDRRQNEIDLVASGQLGVLEPAVATERAKEIAALAEGLLEDFRRVMDEFEKLAAKFRADVHMSNEPRGVVLERFFKGYLTLDATDAGRTFAGFYKLLSDEAQQELLTSSLERLRDEDFFNSLDDRDKRLLTNLVQDLVVQAIAISKVTSAIDESLRRFVEGPDFMRGRELDKLLAKAISLAIECKDYYNPITRLETALSLSARKFRSVSQLIWDPLGPRAPLEAFRKAGGSGLDLAEIWEAVDISEIDFEDLKGNILAMLELMDPVSVVEVLERYPARQGLASVAGLIHLAHRHGERVEDSRETACWKALGEMERSSRIDKWIFRRARADELRASHD